MEYGKEVQDEEIKDFWRSWYLFKISRHLSDEDINKITPETFSVHITNDNIVCYYHEVHNGKTYMHKALSVSTLVNNGEMLWVLQEPTVHNPFLSKKSLYINPCLPLDKIFNEPGKFLKNIMLRRCIIWPDTWSIDRVKYTIVHNSSSPDPAIHLIYEEMVIFEAVIDIESSVVKEEKLYVSKLPK